MKMFIMIAVALATPALAAREGARINPIRKVVNLLQGMQQQVIAEGKRDEELYHKFMCYCETGVGTLQQSIADGKAKIANLEAENKENIEKKAQTDADLKKHQADRKEAKEAMAKATALRKKEAAAYAKYSADSKANIKAVDEAIIAIEKGMGDTKWKWENDHGSERPEKIVEIHGEQAAAGFLQSSTARVVRNVVMDAEMSDASRDAVLAFLSGTQQEGYVPQSQEIVGILKQMNDEMRKDLADATKAEQEAIAQYKGLMAAKAKQVASLTKQIEHELKLSGELAVALAEFANDLEDTKEAVAADEKFLAELESSCDTKKQEWEAVKKMRTEELLAISETIRVLNDDDALELFKKTLPSAAASFVQIQVSATATRTRARAILQGVRGTHPELDLISLALDGKAVGFEKVIAMIDELVANLKIEQQNDDQKKEYCDTKIDETEDKRKELENAISDADTAIDELEGAIATLSDEIKALEDGIKALDKAVAEATAQRKEEHAEYETLMANDNAAKEVLSWAKNRLNKFYNPKLYVPPPKRELSEEDRITVNMGGTLAPTFTGGIAGTGITAFSQGKVAPPPPPETFGPYTTKHQENQGVLSMIDLLVTDLDKEMTTATADENNSQADYAKMMADAAAKRAADSKSVEEKTGAKADAEGRLHDTKTERANLNKELGITLELEHSLHSECDWLLKYFVARKEARAGEIDALGRAKAVLAGADYSLVETGRASRAFLSRR